MKRLLPLLSLAICLLLLAGCVGTPVVYHSDCDCPDSLGSQNTPLAEGELKTGLTIITDVSGSSDATAEKNGESKYDITIVAVLVDKNDIIRDCIIDGISSSVKFDAKGALADDLSSKIKTKNELGDSYGMVAYGGAKSEWYKQAEALASFAIGKTAKQLREGAVDKTGKAPAGSDLATSATIYLGGYVDAIEIAAANAQNLGAKVGDKLSLATVSTASGSKSAAEKDGTAQLDATSAAVSIKDGVITSCLIDSVQAKVTFNTAGKITTDLKTEIKTKNELGDSYGMVAYGGAIAEWNTQAATFAKYITGKTPAEVAGISVNESKKPTDADLSSSVTIAIGDFMDLIVKAAK